MQTVSLLRGLGADRLFTAVSPIATIAPSPTASTAPTKGTCTADGAYIWDLTAGGVGYWRRRSATEQCTATSGTQIDPRTGGGGVTVTDPWGNQVQTTVMPPPIIDIGSANVRDGRTQMIEVGPFQFSAATKTSTYWWSPNRTIPAEWQTYIKHAFSATDPTNSLTRPMEPAIGRFFDQPPQTFNASFIGTPTANTSEAWKTKPTWAPIARTKHPTSGEDYGIFIAALYERGDLAPGDPLQKVALYFIWAPIQKSWYERLWDWIVEVVAKLVDFVCGKLTDPATAATTQVAAAAGGPVTVGAATGATLLCQSSATAPTEVPDQPAITPKPVWPYYLAGGLALFGLLAFLLVPPKKRPA